MTHAQEIAKRLVGAVDHTLNGNGPASVRLSGPRGAHDGCVVFVMPAEVGIIIDDALDKLYKHLGWNVSSQEQGEIK